MRQACAALAVAGALVWLAAPAWGTAQGSNAAPTNAGARAFQKCYSCHALGDTDEGAQGPSLKGIVGRAVASWPGYDFSPAMRTYAERQPRWSRAALDAFLADPQGMVPGSEMAFIGIRDADERAALIDYLASR